MFAMIAIDRRDPEKIMNKPKFSIKNDEILRIIEKDLGPGRRSGLWVMFSCPFPGHEHGDRHPSLGVTPDNGRFYCFSCGRTGDAVTYLQLREGLTFIESCKRLSLFRFEDGPKKTTSRPLEIPPTFDEKWQSASNTLIERSEKSLWSSEGSRALTWLRVTRGSTRFNNSPI